jgi:hypothetical protein
VTPPPGYIGSVILFEECEPGKKIVPNDIKLYDLMARDKCLNVLDDVSVIQELASPTVLRNRIFKGNECHPPQSGSYDSFRSCEKSTILVAFPFAHSGDYSPSTEPPTGGPSSKSHVEIIVASVFFAVAAICTLSYFGYRGWKSHRERREAIQLQEDLVNESFDDEEEENDLL